MQVFQVVVSFHVDKQTQFTSLHALRRHTHPRYIYCVRNPSNNKTLWDFQIIARRSRPPARYSAAFTELSSTSISQLVRIQHIASMRVEPHSGARFLDSFKVSIRFGLL